MATMYFITAKDSETGKKFSKLNTKMKECHAACVKLSEKYGFNQWRQSIWSIAGGFSAVLFPKGTVIDAKLWKKAPNGNSGEYMPRGNTKAGKEIQTEFDKTPRVEIGELNICVGIKEQFSHIGYALGSADYFGFSIEPKWRDDIPSDCEEVTFSKYQELFNK